MYKELYLLLTEACPNRCEYCYIKDRANPSSMSIEDIDKYIAKYHPTRVLFFGGEPLVRLDLIEDTVKKYYGKIKFQLVTSTSVNFKEFLEFNERYPLDEIQLSWDGFNDNRVDMYGNRICDTVYQNIIYAINHHLKFDIKTVVSNKNVKDMYDMHRIFRGLTRFGISGQFVIAHREEWTDEFYVDLKQQLYSTFDLNKMYKIHLNMIIAILAKDNNFCSCDIGKYTTIDPYGNESCCTALSQQRMDLDICDVQERCTHNECKNCQYAFMCDGGCRYERYLAYGDKWKENYLTSTCKVVKIYYDTVQRFLSELDSDKMQKLLSIIRRYKEYQYKYYSPKE